MSSLWNCQRRQSSFTCYLLRDCQLPWLVETVQVKAPILANHKSNWLHISTRQFFWAPERNTDKFLLLNHTPTSVLPDHYWLLIMVSLTPNLSGLNPIDCNLVISYNVGHCVSMNVDCLSPPIGQLFVNSNKMTKRFFRTW